MYFVYETIYSEVSALYLVLQTVPCMVHCLQLYRQVLRKVPGCGVGAGTSVPGTAQP